MEQTCNTLGNNRIFVTMTMTYIGHCPNLALFSKRGTDEDRETEWNRLVKVLETKKNK